MGLGTIIAPAPLQKLEGYLPLVKYSESSHYKGSFVSQTAALYHLQTLDSQRDSALARLTEIDKLLAQNQAVRAAQQALDDAKKHHTQWKVKSTDLELDRSRLQNEANEAEERLYSGRVSNPREMTDLQEKIASLKHRRDVLEEPLLEAMLEVEQGESDMASAQSSLEQVLEQQKQTLGALATEQGQLRESLPQLVGEIAQTRTGVEAANLALYDKLRKRPGGIAVTRLIKGECSTCGVQLTSRQEQQVVHGEVMPCPTCGRILFA